MSGSVVVARVYDRDGRLIIPLGAQNMSTRFGERNRVLIAIMGILIAGCKRDEQRASQPSRSIVVDAIISVANQHSQEEHIFLQAKAHEHALGVVPGRSSRSFSVPSAAGDSTTELRLEARAYRTGPGFRSTPFLLSSGGRVVWTLDAVGGSVLVNR
jgi:hypothetical protein